MTKNPLLNALAAVTYIALVASIMFYGSKIAGHEKETLLIPIAMLSLFVLSATTMVSIFFYQPIRLCLDGQKQVAVSLFFKTLATFAVITAALLATMFVT